MDTQYLTEAETELFKKILDDNGYPAGIALGNLMTSLKLTPDVCNIERMPKPVAKVIIDYTNQAAQLKNKETWQKIRSGEMPIQDINFILPSFNKRGRRISRKTALDMLKRYYWQILRQQGFLK